MAQEALSLNDREVRLGVCAMRKLVSEITKNGMRTGVGLAAIITAQEAAMMGIFSHGFTPDGRPKAGFKKIDLSVEMTGGLEIHLQPTGLEQFGMRTVADKAVRFQLKSHGNFLVLLLDVWIAECDENAWGHWKFCGAAPGHCRMTPSGLKQKGLFGDSGAEGEDPEPPAETTPESTQDDELNPSREALESFLMKLSVSMEAPDGVGTEEPGQDEAEAEEPDATGDEADDEDSGEGDPDDWEA